MKRREFFGVLGGAVVLPACVALFSAVIVFMAPNGNAQEAEPRSYSNTPVGLNFLIAGYLYTQGKIAFDPELSIAENLFIGRSRPRNSWGGFDQRLLKRRAREIMSSLGVGGSCDNPPDPTTVMRMF